METKIVMRGAVGGGKTGELRRSLENVAASAPRPALRPMRYQPYFVDPDRDELDYEAAEAMGCGKYGFDE